MPGLLQRAAGAAIAGYGQGIVAEAEARRKRTLALMKEARADRRLAITEAGKDRRAGMKTPGSAATEDAQTLAARETMFALGLSPQEFRERRVKPSGFDTLSLGDSTYDPEMDRLAKLAARPLKTKADPDHRSVLEYLGDLQQEPDEPGGTGAETAPVETPGEAGAAPVTDAQRQAHRDETRDAAYAGMGATAGVGASVEGVPVSTMTAEQLDTVFARATSGGLQLTPDQIRALQARERELSGGR